MKVTVKQMNSMYRTVKHMNFYAEDNHIHVHKLLCRIYHTVIYMNFLVEDSQKLLVFILLRITLL